MSARRVPISVVTALAIAVLASAGCGGSSSSASPHSATASSPTSSSTAAAIPKRGPSLSKSQLLSRADAICRRVNTDLAAVKPKGETVQDIARDVPRNIVLERKSLVELESLVPPSSLASSWQQVLAERKMLLGELVKLVQAAKRNDVKALEGLVASKKQSHTALRNAAIRMELTYCSEVG
jgi:hypothetical protein